MTLKRSGNPTSKAKVLANRRNALKSTGPRTPEGKSAARWNCLQHGLVAKAAVIEMGSSPENRQELDHLLSELRTQYKPSGAIEEILVERIATSYWRLRRCQQAEVGEILLSSGGAWSQRPQQRQEAFYNEIAGPHEVPVYRFLVYQRSATGLASLVTQLKQMLKELSEKEGLRSDTVYMIKKSFEGTDLIGKLFSPATSGKAKIEYLRDELIPHFEKLQAEKFDIERLGDHSFIRGSLVPQGLRADLLSRYESHIERQMYRAIQELARLQELRLTKFQTT